MRQWEISRVEFGSFAIFRLVAVIFDPFRLKTPRKFLEREKEP
jgi:hypothetical protein